MEKIFDQHVEKKAMTSTILKNSFKLYIDHFDPERLYLLEDEVRPYQEISNSEMLRMMAQYRTSDLSRYEKLNDVIQKAIIRARGYRKNIKNNPETLFHDSNRTATQLDWGEHDSKRAFSKDFNELRKRIRDHIADFIHVEKRRFGDSIIQRHQDQTLRIYENYLRDHENQYLFLDAQDRTLLAVQKENLFVMHVLKALARSLDSHTTFLNPTEAYDMRVRLEKGFQGIGVVLKQTPEGIFVTRLIEGAPAKESGLVKVNDQIVEINGTNVQNEALDRLTKRLRKNPGSTISLVLKRKIHDGYRHVDKLFHVKLKSELITVNEGRVETNYETFGNGIIGILKLNSFYKGQAGISSEKDMKEAIRKLDRQGNLRGLIIDLRENSGGFLTQAIEVVGLFITNGVVVVSKYSNGEERYYRDMDSTDYFDGPIIILTSKLTASAAEIVAQALQDYGVAIVVGDEQTYGKGTIQSQTVTTGEGSSYFKVTVGKYYSVSGKTPQINGVKADIVVPSQFNLDEIGEEFLEYPLNHDTITPSYQDTLSDIEPRIKPWYMRYYIPTLQQREVHWKEMLPTLKKNSEYRIAQNKNYQLFLNGKLDTDDDLNEDKPKNYGVDDLQLQEAINIVKDMVMLQSRQFAHQE